MSSNLYNNSKINLQELSWSNKTIHYLNLHNVSLPKMAMCHLLIIVLFALTLLKYFLKKQSRKKSFPCYKWGFFRMPIIDELIFINEFHKRGLQFIDKMAQQFGPFLKVPMFGALDMFCVADADAIEKILKSNCQDSLDKPQFAINLVTPDIIKNGLITSTEHIWSCHRKSISPVFKYGPITKYCEYAVDATQDLLNQTLNVANTNTSKIGELTSSEMNSVLELNAVKLITRVVMGDELSSFSEIELVHFRENFESMKQILAERIVKPYLLIPPIWWIHPKKQKYDLACKGVEEFANKIISKYRKKAAEDHHFDDTTNSINSLITQMIQDGFSDEEVSNEILTFLFAGHETVVTAINMLIFHLACNIHHQQICQAEIDLILNQKSDAGNSSGISNLTMRNVNEFKYLERCILESLRITPVVPAFIRTLKTSIKIDDTLSLEPTNNLVIFPWAVHRNPKYYPNPEKFDPDRFLPENVKARRSCAYIPFSVGPRNCIGWKLAIMEMKVIMAGILSCFDMRTTDKLSDVKLNFDVTLKPERPYNVTFKCRSNNNKESL